jgi:hypothetical protein
MIFFLCTLAMGVIAATLWIVAIDGYGRIPDRSARDHLDRFSAAHHPRRDLGTS